MKNIILTGFMGTGKTSVGRLLARRLSCPFIDTDDVIEREEGVSISEIFRELGEGYFRRVEKETIKRLSGKMGVIIATGGGAIIDHDNLKILKASGTLISLMASPEEILKRVEGDTTRPLLSDKDRMTAIKRLMQERERFYKKADIVIDTTGKGVEEVASEIVERLGLKETQTYIEVGLGDRSYPIYFLYHQFKNIGSLLRHYGLYKKVAIVTNPTVWSLYGDRVFDSIKDADFEPVLIKIPDGERFKRLKWISHIYDRMLEHRMDRNSSVIALGGGVIGDMAGFAAATYMRGVPYVQIPTTLLSQVDSSVGGKTGVNHPKGKNMIGAFYQPCLVLIDTGFLDTLKPRELRAGLAEVVKYGVIKDRALFEFLEDNYKEILKLDRDAILHIVRRSCEIKARIVEEDEREKGIRAILNFGHTFGHAIESITGYRRFRHGESISIGMVMAAELSKNLGLCGDDVPERIESLLLNFGLPVKPPPISTDEFEEAMRLDKKVLREQQRFILVRDIGDVVIREIAPGDFSLDLHRILK